MYGLETTSPTKVKVESLLSSGSAMSNAEINWLETEPSIEKLPALSPHSINTGGYPGVFW